MVPSYGGALLDHLADHLIYLSTATSFWYSLDSSYDHEFHLSKRLGMSPNDYEYLLVAAQLAHFHKKWGFSIKKLKWKLFIEGHRFTTTDCTATSNGTFEIDAKTMDLTSFINGVSPVHRVRSHFIRIGRLDANSPRKIELQKYSDGRMIVTPPRLNGFRIKQQSFRQCVEQFKWNYLLEKEEDDDTDADDEDNAAAIDKDDDDDSYTDNDDDNVSSTTMSIKKRKYDIITSSGDGDTSKPDMAKSYPHLSQALGGGDDGFDPVDPSVRRSMHSLLRELNDLLSTEYRLDVSGISNHRISYVRVPRTKSNSSFRNSKEWLDTAIEISGSKHGGTFESAYRITNHII
jgi:hypothetical protein